jgi:anti-sigma factor (TIGR02949 family)
MSAPAREQLEGLGLSAGCVEVVRHLWDYLDDQLSGPGAERLRAHIAACEQCREYEVYQGCFLEAIAKVRIDFGAPDSLRDKLAEQLKGQGCGCWDKVKK